MNKLTEQQVEEINTKINALSWEKAVKVEILGEDHYIAEVTETGAVYLDGSNFEGGLEEMEFMDYSPNDGVDFDELTGEMFQKLVNDLYQEENIVPIIMKITRMSLDIDCFKDEEWDHIVQVSEEKSLNENQDYFFDQTLEKSLLTGVVAEKQDIEVNDQYIALLEWDQEKEKFFIVQFHPEVTKEIEQFNQGEKDA